MANLLNLIQLPFITDSEGGRIPVNWYPTKDDERGIIMRGCPGMGLYTTLGAGPIRCMKEWNGVWWVVSGSGVYRDSVLVGSLDTASGPVWMEYNLVHVMIVDDSYGYIATSTAVAKISDPDFPTPGSLAFQDSYFIIHEKDSQKFYLSALLDGTSWDALDYTSAEGFPDNIVTTFSDHRELWLFGQDTTEPYYNSGDSDFTFTRVSGAFIETGCAAKHSVAKLDNSIVWLSNMGQVVLAVGYKPQIISTRKLDRLWQAFTWSTAEGFSYNFEGHWFYQLNFPSDNRSFIYDAATKAWHERAFGALESMSMSLATCYCRHAGKHLVGSRVNGKIFELSSSTYTDDSSVLTRLLEASSLSSNHKDLFFSELEVKFESGKADATGQGSDPQAMLQWSDDDGNTWSNEVWRAIGKIGEYKNKVLWHRLGMSSDRRWRLVITDPVNANIKGVRLVATPSR